MAGIILAESSLEEICNLIVARNITTYQKNLIYSPHFQEWLDSGVDPEIIYLNVISLEGDVAHEYLLDVAIAKLGESKQTPHSSQYVTAEVARLL
ncbi:MAG: hypothetical protein ACKPCI_29305, partial [Dolichospermum sp.]